MERGRPWIYEKYLPQALGTVRVVKDRVQARDSAAALLVYAFAFQFVETVFAIYQVETSGAWTVLSAITFLWIVWWWLMSDSLRHGVRWPLDLGMFIYIAWPLLVPYHLFSTRGWAGFIPILYFLLSSMLGAAAANVVVFLVAS
ncbi:MAG: hypothetical protein AB7J13_15015 [Pyrinomonadaceae bacterium]